MNMNTDCVKEVTTATLTCLFFCGPRFWSLEFNILAGDGLDIWNCMWCYLDEREELGWNFYPDSVSFGELVIEYEKKKVQITW